MVERMIRMSAIHPEKDVHAVLQARFPRSVFPRTEGHGTGMTL
jgi:hypothetical protein